MRVMANDAHMDNFFHVIQGNPTPENASGGYLTARDGKKFRYACFGAVGRPLNGTVIILPGRNECIEKYFEVVRDLSRRGLGSAILDWRGQGASDRLMADKHRGHVKSFFHYTRDLDQFFDEIVLPDCRGPYYVLAHSTGALIALLGSHSMVNRVRRMVLVAPFLAFTGLPFSMKTTLRLTTLLCWVGLGGLYAAWGPRQTTPFDLNKLTTDPARYRRNTRLYDTYPQLAQGGPTVAWVRAACQAVRVVQDPEFMAGIQVPILFIGAGAEEVVSVSAAAEYAKRLRGGSLLMIDGARHEILQEADVFREQFFAAFDAYVPGTEEVFA